MGLGLGLGLPPPHDDGRTVACVGTLSIEPKFSSAYRCRLISSILGVNGCEETPSAHGSKKPMCPLIPMPSIIHAKPPPSTIACSASTADAIGSEASPSGTRMLVGK